MVSSQSPGEILCLTLKILGLSEIMNSPNTNHYESM
jgi:hypothetical protein